MGDLRDEKKALNTPCYCKTYENDEETREVCWSKGIVGMLSDNQRTMYCEEETKEPLPQEVDTKKLLQELIPDREVENIAKELKG